MPLSFFRYAISIFGNMSSSEYTVNSNSYWCHFIVCAFFSLFKSFFMEWILPVWFFGKFWPSRGKNKRLWWTAIQCQFQNWVCHFCSKSWSLDIHDWSNKRKKLYSATGFEPGSFWLPFLNSATELREVIRKSLKICDLIVLWNRHDDHPP